MTKCYCIFKRLTGFMSLKIPWKQGRCQRECDMYEGKRGKQ